MSGLAALFHRDGRPVDGTAIEAMLAAVPYRGLDGRWVRLWPAVGLGYAKLAVTPEEEHEQQPLVSPRTGCAIIADARLDNREDLLARLPDQPPTSASDAELILRAYDAWGVEAAGRLLGDFAFVVWDPRQQRAVCARDTSGQRPLFYRLDGRTFAAASEIRQLFQDPAVPVVPDEQRIRDYLVPFQVYRNDQEQVATFFAGVSTLLAGHVLVVTASAEQTRRYWELRPPRELRYRHSDEYAWHFQRLLAQAIQARLRTSRPVGALLSGGLDSTSIVSVAQQLYRSGKARDTGFTTFSMQVDGLDCDESRFIEDVRAMYGFEARSVPVLERVANFEPEPAGFMSAPMKPVCEVDLLLAAAGDAGSRVVLSGHWADNCFPWSSHFFGSLLRRARFGEFWRHLQAHRRLNDERWRKVLALHCLLPLLPLLLQRLARAAYVRHTVARERTALVPAWVNEDVRADLLERHLALALDAERQRRFADDPRQLMHSVLYPAPVLPIAGAVPLQIAPPFADRRLHEFMLSIPPEQIYEPHPYADTFYAGHKLILRRAMAGILPESVRTRTQKTLFSALVLREIEQRWPAYEAVFGPPGRSELAARGYIDPGPLWQRLQGWRAGQFGADGVYVMRVLHLETWLRTLRLPRARLASPFLSLAASSNGTQPSHAVAACHGEGIDFQPSPVAAG